VFKDFPVFAALRIATALRITVFVGFQIGTSRRIAASFSVTMLGSASNSGGFPVVSPAAPTMSAITWYADDVQRERRTGTRTISAAYRASSAPR
jgi:hypothetical protein